MSPDDQMVYMIADYADELAEKVCRLERAMRLFITVNPDGCTSAMYNGRWCFTTKIDFTLDGIAHHLVIDTSFPMHVDFKTGMTHLNGTRKLPTLHENIKELSAINVYVYTNKVGERINAINVFNYHNPTLINAYEIILQRGGDKPYNPEDLINEAIEFCEDYL